MANTVTVLQLNSVTRAYVLYCQRLIINGFLVSVATETWLQPGMLCRKVSQI